MPKSKCSRAYHELENSKINEFTTGVSTGVYGNATDFASPPVTKLIYDGYISDFVLKLDAWNGGGTDQRGPFLDSKETLTNATDDMADFVDGVANGNETLIVEGGFTPTKTTRTSKPAPLIPTGTTATAIGNGKIDAQCDRMANAEYYGCVCSTSATSLNNIFSNGQFNFSALNNLFILVDVNKDRVKSFSGLAGGTNYYVQFFCGNSKGTSLLGEPIRVMATS